MPIATTLPSKNVVIRFAPSRADTEVEEGYQLLELPAEILKTVESSKTPVPLIIKGRPSDDAVLCTPYSTFLLRTVGISNSLLVCRPPASHGSSSDIGGNGKAEGRRPTLEIRDISHEVLECVPQAANLERIRAVLKDSAWKGLDGDSDGDRDRRTSLGKRKREERRWTRAQLESVVQASEGELSRGLKERNVVEVDGKLLLLPIRRLVPLLNLVLTLLTIHSTSTYKPVASPAQPIIDGLVEHDVAPALGRAVLELFGDIDAETSEWVVDITRLVAEVGKGLLADLQDRSEPREVFMDRWKETVGETWAEHCDLKLLEGEYLLTTPEVTATLLSSSPSISYFPLHTLPLQPAIRFADLFLTRARWRPDDMIPFLKGLYRDGDSKERDKLVTKFVRVVKEKEGTWWYPRRTA